MNCATILASKTYYGASDFPHRRTQIPTKEYRVDRLLMGFGAAICGPIDIYSGSCFNVLVLNP
jgi:hypothetical protein